MDIHQFKKDLRSNQTEAENRIWFFLRAKRFGSLKFKRKPVIGPHIPIQNHFAAFCLPFLLPENLSSLRHRNLGMSRLRKLFLETKTVWHRPSALKSDGYRSYFSDIPKKRFSISPLSDFYYAALEKSVSPSRGETKLFTNQYVTGFYGFRA